MHQLSERDQSIIRQCLKAAVEGPFFPEWEFHTLMGLTRQEMAHVLDSWPAAADERTRDLAVINALNNLLGYPHGQAESLTRLVEADPAEIEAILRRLQKTTTN